MPIFFLTCCGDAEGNPEKCSDDRDRVIHRHVVVVLFFLRRHNKLFVSFFLFPGWKKKESQRESPPPSFIAATLVTERTPVDADASCFPFVPPVRHMNRAAAPHNTFCRRLVTFHAGQLVLRVCVRIAVFTSSFFFFFFSACVPNRPWSVSWMAGTTTTTTQGGKYGEYKKIEREGIVTLHEMRAASQTAWRRLNYATKRLARTRRTAASPKTGGWVGPPHSTRAPFPLSLFLFFFILLPFSFFYDNNNKQPVKKKKKKTSLRR